MTEQEWLASGDPVAMLRHLHCYPTGSANSINLRNNGASPRKLRLFACTVARLLPDQSAEAIHAVALAEAWADDEKLVPESRNGVKWMVHRTNAGWAALSILGFAADMHVAQRPSGDALAALLRDIVGNPFRPVTLPQRADGGPPAEAVAMGGILVRRRPGNPHLFERATRCPWLIPTVVSIAGAAYEERPGRKCRRCLGWGLIRNSRGGRPYEEIPCPNCKGPDGRPTGRVEDGTLDPERLAVLADALEEVGARFPCPNCEGRGWFWEDDDRKLAQFDCGVCRGSSVSPNCLLAHLRSPGPHVRGCWALDLLLGKV